MKTTSRNHKVEIVAISAIEHYKRNARKHSKKQIGKIAQSIKKFGWTVPLLIDGDGNLIAGHGRLEAAKLLGLKKVPVIRITDLSEKQIMALRLADNRIAEEADWDEDLLAAEFQALMDADLDFEITDTGFDMPEIDNVLGESVPDSTEAEILSADLEGISVTVPGDLWLVGRHRLLCGDALEASDYKILLDKDKAQMVITDPPYNVPIERNVSGLGQNKHGEFMMASGEMSDQEFTDFLTAVFQNLVAFSDDGSIHDIFMDWRHQGEIIKAGSETYSELKNTCVWTKSSGGMGSLYRSGHEFVYVFKSGKASHINNISLGAYGRNRTNVWPYAGVNSFGKGREQALAMHPTVKPVALIADAILDCSHRKGIVLDPFAGSGTVLIAAERTGRSARAMELDPTYVDVALRRYRRVTGIEPVHSVTGLTFSETEQNQMNEQSLAVSSQAGV